MKKYMKLFLLFLFFSFIPLTVKASDLNSNNINEITEFTSDKSGNINFQIHKGGNLIIAPLKGYGTTEIDKSKERIMYENKIYNKKVENDNYPLSIKFDTDKKFVTIITKNNGVVTSKEQYQIKENFPGISLYSGNYTYDFYFSDKKDDTLKHQAFDIKMQDIELFSVDKPHVGEKFYGTLNAWYDNSIDHFPVSFNSGILQGVNGVIMNCDNPGAAYPGQYGDVRVYNYTYTITSINTTTGYVYGEVYATDRDYPCNGSIYGYQALRKNGVPLYRPSTKIQKSNLYYNLNGGQISKTINNPNGYYLPENGIYSFQTRLNGNFYIHVSESPSLHDSDSMHLWTGNGENSKFVIERYKDTPYYYIISTTNGKAMNVKGYPGSLHGSGTYTQLWSQTNGGSEEDFLWYFRKTSTGIEIVNKANNLVLDARAAGTSNGTVIQMHTYLNSTAQKWELQLRQKIDFPNRLRVTNQNCLINSATPVKTGYVFNGWNTKPDGSGTKYSAAQNIPVSGGDITLYAQWKQNSFTNTIDHWMWGFKNKEGNNGDRSAFKINSTSFKANSGSSFVMDSSKKVTIPNGFYIEQDFGSDSIDGSWKNYPFGTKVTQKSNSMSFEYDYQPINYKITYNLNGGINNSSNPSTYNVLYGLTLKNPTRSGYKFLGWYDGNTKVNGINQGANALFSSTTDMYKKLSGRRTGNITLTAKWQQLYAINVNAVLNGQDVTSMDGSWFTFDVYINGSLYANDVADFCDYFEQGTKYEIKDIKPKTGKKYIGTTYNSALSGTLVNANASIWLKFVTTHTITLKAPRLHAGTTWIWDIGTKYYTMDYGSKFNMQNYINVFTSPKGYHYGGASTDDWWETAKNGIGSDHGGTYMDNPSNGGSSTFTVTTDMTAQLHYYPNTYTIKYNGNGNTGGSTTSSLHTYDVAKALTTNGFTKIGYSFTGWNTEADGTGTAYTNQQSVKNLTSTNGATINLYAQWTVNNYTVRFNGNGATSGTMQDQKFVYDKKQALNENTFARIGYTFTGWNTKPEGNGTSFKDKQEVINLTSVNNGIVNLYAQWTENVLTVNYYSNNATQTFNNSLNADKIGEGKNVLTRSVTYSATKPYKDGLYDYLDTTDPNMKIFRDYWTGTGYYSTSIDGSNKIIVSEKTSFNSGMDLAKALGVDITYNNTTINIYPQWRKNTLSIQYNVNNGELIEGTKSIYTLDNEGFIVKNKTDRNIQVYAFDQWLNNSETNSFFNYNSKVGPFNIKLTGHTGKEGAEWNTRGDGSGISYNQNKGYKVSELANLKDSDQTLSVYVNWRQNVLKVYYNANMGSLDLNLDFSKDKNENIIYTNNQKFYQAFKYNDPNDGGLVNNTTFGLKYPGFKFMGWTLEKDKQPIFDQNDETIVPTDLNKAIEDSDAEITIYAYWKLNAVVKLNVEDEIYHVNDVVTPDNIRETLKVKIIDKDTNQDVTEESFPNIIDQVKTKELKDYDNIIYNVNENLDTRKENHFKATYTIAISNLGETIKDEITQKITVIKDIEDIEQIVPDKNNPTNPDKEDNGGEDGNPLTPDNVDTEEGSNMNTTNDIRYISKKYINTLNKNSKWRNDPQLKSNLINSLNKKATDENSIYVIEISKEEADNMKEWLLDGKVWNNSLNNDFINTFNNIIKKRP